MTRAEHLEWCKERAREYLNRGDINQAVTSMLSDLSKHDETRGAGKAMAPIGMLYLLNSDADGAKRFIEGFN